MENATTVILSKTVVGVAIPDAPRVEIPAKIGPVTLVRPIGEGGMSVVHLGRHELLNKNVAVKFLLDIPGSADDPKFTAFLEGARAAATILHPGLNVVYNADSIEGVPYLVMELIEGPNISELIKRNTRLPLNIARAIIESTCAAVAELHDHQMIHRDIKPANIMIDPTGRVVVTDFGLAMPRPAALFGGPAGGIAGTPAYMAPEMFEGNVSNRTDVYALGATLYECLTGKPPFDGDFAQLRFAHRSTPPPIGPLVAAGVPEEVIVVIERSLSKDVLFRPKSARHVMDSLAKAFADAGIDRATETQIQRFMEVGGNKAASAPDTTRATPAVSYYERLNTLASSKRATPDGADLADILAADAAAAPVADESPSNAPAAAAVSRPDVPVAPGAGKCFAPHVAIAGIAPLVACVLGVAPYPREKLTHAVERVADMFSLVQHLSDGTTKLPFLVSIPANILPYLICYALPVGLGLYAYERLSLTCPPRDGVTRCGWCGGTLDRLSDPRCPHCGKVVGGQARSSHKRREPAPLNWVPNRLCRYGTALVVYTVCFAFIVPEYMKFFAQPMESLSAAWFVRLALVNVALWSVSAVVFHAIGKRCAFQTGRTWCGKCGGSLAGAVKPECPTCHESI